MSPDLGALRTRFPVLRERIYCDNQGLGCFPEEMLADLDEYRRTLLLRNRGLGVWIERIEELRGEVERLLGATSGSVAFRDSVTAGQAAIAAAIEPEPARRRIVIAPSLDFGSTRFLWTQQELRGFELVEVGVGRDELSAEDIEAMIDERTSVVALPLVSPRTGALLPLERVAARARAAGALFVVDAYQALGIVPVDVGVLGADVVVGGSHKWLYGGGTGLAFLWIAPALAERLPVVYPGWLGHHELLGAEPRFSPAPLARRFQQGTPAVEPVYTARAGLRFVAEIGVEALRARSVELTGRLLEGVARHGLRTITPTAAERRGGMICIDVPDPHAAVDALAARGIDVGARPRAGVRVGPHPCLSLSDCDEVVDQLARLARV